MLTATPHVTQLHECELKTQRVRASGRQSVAPRVSAGSSARAATEPVKRAIDVLIPPSPLPPVSRAYDREGRANPALRLRLHAGLHSVAR